MSSLPYFIVDVFAEEKYAGNQLAVFTSADGLSTEQMQQIAKEVNYSETTFVLSTKQQDEGYDVRIFTPTKELPFAGHPTLGTAFVLQQEVIRQPVEQVALNLKVGQIPVTILYSGQSPDILWMQQNPPVFGDVLTAETIAPVLSLDTHDMDSRFPIQEVSTGVPFIIVPLISLDALQRIKVNVDRLFPVVENLQAKEILVFCPETRHSANQFSARVFAHYLGVPEDPATGSANGCFAGYLVQHAYFGETRLDVRVEQGYEMGRPSLLRLKAQKVEEKINVFVGGRVIKVAQGEFV